MLREKIKTEIETAERMHKCWSRIAAIRTLLADEELAAMLGVPEANLVAAFAVVREQQHEAEAAHHAAEMAVIGVAASEEEGLS